MHASAHVYCLCLHVCISVHVCTSIYAIVYVFVHCVCALVNTSVCARVRCLRVWWSGQSRGQPSCCVFPVRTLWGRKAISLNDSMELQKTRLHRTKPKPLKFFSVCDSRKLPSLSSASYIHDLSVSRSFFISWHFSSRSFSFVCLSSWFIFCLCRVWQPYLICLSRCLGPVLHQSVTFLCPGSG